MFISNMLRASIRTYGIDDQADWHRRQKVVLFNILAGFGAGNEAPITINGLSEAQSL